jgi:ApaG protein
MALSCSTSTQIRIETGSVFLSDYSKPNKSEYLFCYKVSITNDSPKTVQLISRHWIIIDSESHRDEVVGDGVVGKQPKLEPGENYSYYSFCNLKTNFGTMEGKYFFVDDEGNEFSAAIPRFFLANNLNQFEANNFLRGSIVKHKHEEMRGVVVDYDMYFLNDEKLYNADNRKPSKDKPWYYVLVDSMKTIAYVAQEHLELSEDKSEIKHPLVEFFFDGFDGERYKRNERTWQDLKII